MTSSRHPCLVLQSQKRLDQARETACQKTGYDCKAMHQALINRYGELTGNTVYKWQLDVAEALLLKLNCVAIAGTGSGKTVSFTLSLLLSENCEKIAIIISPLKTLQEEQAECFEKLEVRAVAVNGDTWSWELYKDLSGYVYQGIFTGLEMIMEFEEFKSWQTRPTPVALHLPSSFFVCWTLEVVTNTEGYPKVQCCEGELTRYTEP
ncbi:hypothetical protein E1B28_006735 [Marasmius oreades]|uniref:DEAD/DEAH-box helicase domain-containing protein n=1 Tax=Marasmius oreades TaxID=181124 RepID=A0A9P7UWR1_9AGAR|nr:uncharacterized protein E1B28_006735 [Marasmius oreades]KAG7096054.1 hypothetical protein E1B28_006735 [Marasmius oreades]